MEFKVILLYIILLDDGQGPCYFLQDQTMAYSHQEKGRNQPAEAKIGVRAFRAFESGAET
jgi:hypothetical protein